MKIRQHDWVIGSLLSADSNAQSFNSPDSLSRNKKRSAQELSLSGEDSVSIDPHTAFGCLDNSATANVGRAISLRQTQDGFLQNVQEALHRMSELSVLAQSEAKSDLDRRTYTNEFAQLQHRIQGLGSKMFEAVRLFHSTTIGKLTEEAAALSGQAKPAPPDSDPVKVCLKHTADPALTAITNSKSASEAIATIDNALKTVTKMRSAVSATIQRLGEAGEQLSALREHLSGKKKRIKGGDVAELSTRFARYDILGKSGTAMLAQANALPQSALRLLN